ncbi:MAG: discoidin domain-containing protein, partial [Thermoguttaceae bacterium]
MRRAMVVWLLSLAGLGAWARPGLAADDLAFVTASSVHAKDYPADYALDGNPKTRWASQGFRGKPEWLQIDFGQPVDIGQLIIVWEAAYAAEYQIQVSADAKTWQTAGRKTDGRGGTETLTGLSGQGRYLRVLCQKPGPHGLFSIWEVRCSDQAAQALAKRKRAVAQRRAEQEAEARRRLAEAFQGRDVEEIIFALRQPGKDGHWYANFSYYADSEDRKTYGDGGKLCRLNVKTGQGTVLLQDDKGAVRDPIVHYDAQKILFSYRPGGTPHYHLYEINVDGTGLRQLTDGPFDDIEPTYLPCGDIVFVSSRCKRWVNCWLTKVAVLHRCDAEGKEIRA